METKKKQPVYKEEFKRSAVEMVIHSGKPIVQIGRELGVSEASLHAWKKAYLKQQGPGEIDGQQKSAEQMLEEIRELRKENEYLKRQREILKKAMSILGEESTPGMR
jgi:transposase